MSSEQGSETLGETTPRSTEQLITETRADRDAARSDPANWSRLDLNRMPDAGRYFPEPRTGTAESVERVGEAGTRQIPGTPEAASTAGATDRGRITVVFAEADQGLPGPHAPVADYAPPGSQRPDQGAVRIQDVADVRDALLAGHRTSDIRRAVTDQVPDPKSEPTTELVREDEQGRRYELGTPQDGGAVETVINDRGQSELKENVDPRQGKLEGLRRETVKRIDDTADVFKNYGDKIYKAFVEKPASGPTHTGTRADVPYIHEQQPREGVGAGDAVTGILAGGLLVAEGVKHAVRRRLRSMKEEHDAGDR